MKRIDDLNGAIVKRVNVSRSGILHIYLERRRVDPERWNGDCEWSPLIIRIPKEPKKRRWS